MKNAILVFVLSSFCVLLSGCHKDKEVITDPTLLPAAPLVDPVSWNPSVVQTNTNASQFNYGPVRIVKGLSMMLTGMNPGDIGTNSLHIYLRAASGSYLHLPATSVNGVAYGYYIKSVSPHSLMFITRASGVAETYNDIIILAAKLTYLQSLPAAINFADYGTAKAKLGF